MNELAVALRDLDRLLEDHAPYWFTYQHYRRSELGLRQEGQCQAEAFEMLYDLLEQYAPPWYTRELHQGARLAARRLKRVEQRTPKGCREPGAILETGNRDPGR